MLVWFYEKLASRLEEEDGATAVEYGIMVALIAAVIIGTVVILGQKILQAFNTIVSNLG
ncbi:MAG: Flp family type IVb pilin [Firmicutes bacterium]|nr:Flp family type IVb pilin [Bacillota bacterium]